MPDITMCTNSACRSANLCYRYTANPSERQSYAVFTPNQEGDCDHFTPTAPTKDNIEPRLCSVCGVGVNNVAPWVFSYMPVSYFCCPDHVEEARSKLRHDVEKGKY